MKGDREGRKREHGLKGIERDERENVDERGKRGEEERQRMDE
jgi:hypothetical protein